MKKCIEIIILKFKIKSIQKDMNFSCKYFLITYASTDRLRLLSQILFF